MMGRVQVPPNPLIDATGHHGTHRPHRRFVLELIGD